METKKRLFYPTLILCIGIVLCVSLTSIFLSLSKTRKVDSATNISSYSYNIYLLSLSKSAIETQAVQLGKDSMINNNAGYIWESEGLFHSIASAYKNENDATLMKNKLEKSGIESDIIKVNFPAVKISSSYSMDEKNILSSAINIFHDSYFSLYDISIALDTDLNNETSASLSINQVLSNFNTVKNNFDTLFPSDESTFIATIKSYLNDAHESLSLLSGKTFITPTQTLSSLIKYRYCEILDLNCNLIENL